MARKRTAVPELDPIIYGRSGYLIVTRYLPSTNCRGARIAVGMGPQLDHRRVFPYEHEARDAHNVAAAAYAKECNLHPRFPLTRLVGAQVPRGNAYWVDWVQPVYSPDTRWTDVHTFHG